MFSGSLLLLSIAFENCDGITFQSNQGLCQEYKRREDVTNISHEIPYGFSGYFTIYDQFIHCNSFCSDIVFKKIKLGIYFLTMQSDFNAKSPKVIYSKDIATCLMP